MKTVAILAGLPVDVHDRIRRESAELLVSGGRLIVKPLSAANAYNRQYADAILREIHDFMKSQSENEKISVIMCYVTHPGERDFLKAFFPHALVRNIKGANLAGANNNNERNRLLNEYVVYIRKQLSILKSISNAVKERTDIRNLTPLLLPLRNFKSDYFIKMISNLFDQLGSHPDPRQMLDTEINQFFKRHPRVHPDDSAQHCFSDGTMYFKTPGRHRHGYYRHNNDDGHAVYCLINARSRLGGPYEHAFHYDCSPAKGKLADHFPNCHGEPGPAKEKHVNIAPNDYVIG